MLLQLVADVVWRPEDVLELERLNTQLSTVEVCKRQTEVHQLVFHRHPLVHFLLLICFRSRHVRNLDVKRTRLVEIDIEYLFSLILDVIVQPRLSVMLGESIHRRALRLVLQGQSRRVMEMSSR